MDNQINNLKLANKKLNTLVTALDTIVLDLEKLDKTKGGSDELQKEVEGLQKNVDYQKCQIKDYHEFAEEGKVEFERIY
jgi:soluble cytochrome b562